jgi:hypothetical protein
MVILCDDFGRCGAEVSGNIERRRQLESQVAPLRKRIGQIDELISLLNKIDDAGREEVSLSARIQATHEKVKKLDDTLRSLGLMTNALENELSSLKEAGTFRRLFMRSEDRILRESQEVTQQKVQVEAQVYPAKQEHAGIIETRQKLLVRIDELRQRIPRGAGGRKELETEKNQIESKMQPLSSEIASINKKLTDMELTVVQDARIVGATVTKTYLSPRKFVGFDTVVVDEASMVMLPALYYVAGLAAERVVISGDFRQLPPIVQTNQRVLDENIGKDVFKAAGIIDDVEAEKKPQRLVMLNTQYRMQKPICDLISLTIYGGKLKTSRDAALVVRQPPEPFRQTLTIVDTSKIWPFNNRDAYNSKYNLMHALAIRNVCLHLHQQGFILDNGDVGLATPYSAQAKLLRRILKGHRMEKTIAAGTVHRFQGDEKRLIILDVPDTMGEERVGTFLEADNPQDSGASLFNVAISRAQDYLVVFANLTYLQHKLPDRALLRDILNTMQSRGRIVEVQDILALRPVVDDLRHLQGHFELDLAAEKAGLFHHKDFEAVCRKDLENAKSSLAIFSGFVTRQRVASYGDLLRRKISEDVAIRCVTRPPRLNGSIPVDQGKQALDALEGLGCVVDTRSQIHEKVVIIDERIVWFGSLNLLSHTARTDEMMMRIDNPAVALQVAIFMARKRVSSTESGEGLSVTKENPACPLCKSRTSYSRGPYGAYWSCESCTWKNSIDKPILLNPNSIGDSRPRNVTNAPKCPKCGKRMEQRTGPFGPFYGCSAYPKCNGKLPVKAKIKK